MKARVDTRQQLLVTDLAWPWACIAPKGTAGKRPAKEGAKWARSLRGKLEHG
eukprot:CAMPEP_0203991172 /NCGR_PEP_ID=MMETSP0360-20130528/9295_1 /ASSEMBLY_ACC=CAM_ASM_000342 /TAXON_ID=268821 /ORGANISM="Scrippsiella Hangoei, Strain SHTV-5" /LENGTH=51 /DNA_ID=CAMNT_0050931325 /DNA_START=348 /DNA_END=499 /DNA_ORIENTATION=+